MFDASCNSYTFGISHPILRTVHHTNANPSLTDGGGILDDTHLFRTTVGVISASSHFHILVIQGEDFVYVVHSRIVRTARSRSHYLHIWIINLKSEEKIEVTTSGIMGDI